MMSLMMLTIMILPLSIAIIITLLTMSLNFSKTKNREKNSAFECGFDPPHLSRLPFSLRFFLLAVLFLIFDIEIILILPLPLAIPTFPLSSYLIPSITFLFIVTIGFLHEWNEGMLKWTP